MTCGVTSVLNLPQWRFLNFATIDSDRTPCVESAAGGWIDGRGHIASKNDPLFLRAGIGNRSGAQQGLSVGMLRRGANLPAGPDFNKLAEIHHANSSRD